jgi:hypothetical protein
VETGSIINRLVARRQQLRNAVQGQLLMAVRTQTGRSGLGAETASPAELPTSSVNAPPTPPKPRATMEANVLFLVFTLRPLQPEN